MVRDKRSTAALELEAFLPYRLSVLSNTVSTAIASVYEQRFRLSIPEWRVMAILGRYPGLSAAEVAERTAMDKVAVSRAVARLLKSGRILRRLHDTDRRRSQLSLSEDGEAVYRQVAPQALALEGELLEVLDEAERAAFSDILARLMERAVAMRVRNRR